MPTLPESPSPAPTHGLTRRGVVRTAAWSVPVITLVTAAPAFAASGLGEIAFEARTAYWRSTERPLSSDGSALFGSLTLTSLAPDKPTPPLLLTITFPETWIAGTADEISMAYGRVNGIESSDWGDPGWTSTMTQGEGGLVTSANPAFSFTHTGNVGAATTGSSTFFFDYSAWITGVPLSTTLDDLQVVVQVLDDETWQIQDGGARTITVALGGADPGAG